MEKTFNQELTKLDLEEISKSIEAGNTGGIIDSGETDESPSYRISWNIEIDKFQN